MKRVLVENSVGYQVAVEMKGNLQEYAMNFLKIFNNVKNEEDLISVSNDRHNRVYVICREDAVEATKEFLGYFGDVDEEVEKILLVSIAEYINYDFYEYDDMFILSKIE